MQHEQIFYKLQIVLQSKIEEFQYLNYPTITKEQLWTYCVEKKWRKKNVDELRLYELVATIFTVTASDVITHLSRKNYVPTHGLAEINSEELEMLLGGKSLHD